MTNTGNMLRFSDAICIICFGPMSKESSWAPDLYRVTIAGKVEYFNGLVECDGHTWDGTPVKTDTQYKGFNFDMDLGWKFRITHTVGIGPLEGFGINFWTRDIKSTDLAIGYEEKWQTVFVRLGGEGKIIFPEYYLKLFTKLEANIPVLNENKVDLGGCIGDIELKPEPYKLSFWTEWGIRWHRYQISILGNNFVLS